MNHFGNTLAAGKGIVQARSLVIGRSFEWVALALDILAILATCLLAAGIYH